MAKKKGKTLKPDKFRKKRKPGKRIVGRRRSNGPRERGD